MKKTPILIAGPCAAESQEQIQLSIKEAKKRNIRFLRISLWKPRTKPGFDGLGEDGIPFLVEAALAGVNPSTEVIIPQHAEKVVKAIREKSRDTDILIWIGARNQNHYIQQEIARAISNERGVFLMVKNQPWTNEEHWMGIIEHVLHGGINEKRLFICHRGFSPTGENPSGYRNVPDYEMAMKIKMQTGFPMLFDPSHTGGSVAKVQQVAKEAAMYDFDGLIVEVHPDPTKAITDAKQQLTWAEFDTLPKPRENRL